MPDNLTVEQRHRSMSRVKNKNTDIEQRLRSALHRSGLRFKKHVKDLPGTPDLVFTRVKIAVFIDGDFWHGYAFNKWRGTLKPFWQDKIAKNRARDLRNFKHLRKMGWMVLRVWQHEIEGNLPAATERVRHAWKRRLEKSTGTNKDDTPSRHEEGATANEPENFAASSA